jgi:hypothetical protein
MTEMYEIRVLGRLGPVLCGTFTGMRAVVVPRRTTIDGWLSRDELRALVQRMEEVGGQLVHLDCRVADHQPWMRRERSTHHEHGATGPAKR